jgi:hypothetical protein
MKNIKGKIALFGLLFLFLLPFTPIIWIWFNFSIFAKVAGTFGVIIIGCIIANTIIGWGEKE